MQLAYHKYDWFLTVIAMNHEILFLGLIPFNVCNTCNSVIQSNYLSCNKCQLY